MPISEQTLEEIRSRTDIVELIGAYFPLKRAGANFVALCPFHREKSPSFSVSPQKQIFYCFGCQAGGNIFKFVMLRENIDFPAAARMLAERAGVPLHDQRPDPGVGRSEKELLYQVHEQVCSFYQLQLAQTPAAQIARDYLAKRQLSAESIKLFRIGYSPNSWDATLSWARAKKFSPLLLERAGLAIRKGGENNPVPSQTDRFYDRFRGRLMFPICDEQGRVVAFSGRVLIEETQPAQGKSNSVPAAKYVNSPETPIFQKGKILFGLDKTKRALLEEKSAIVCEGQIDLISCYQRGIANVVAPQGTALTVEHGRILKRYVDEVVLCFDADSAGQGAAARSLDGLLESGLVVRVATLPDGHDPDTLVRQNGADCLLQLIRGAPGYFDFRLEALCREHNPATDTGKSQIVRALLESLAKVNNAVLRDQALRLTAQRLAIRESALREELTKLLARRDSSRRILAQPGPASSNPARKVISTPEKELLHLLLADDSGTALQAAVQSLDRATLPENDYSQWIGKILDQAPSPSGKKTNWPTTVLAEELQNGALAGLALTPLHCVDVAEAAKECIGAIHKAARRAEIDRVQRALRSPHSSAREREKLSRLLLDLQRHL